MKIYFAFIVLFVFCMGCIDQVNFETDGYQYKLIVDGSISNVPGPYKVKLFKSKQYTEPDETEPTYATKVSIVEQGGKTVDLKEKEIGIYETDSIALRGEVGKTYYIKIIGLNGKTYQSKPETILPPVPIDTYKIDFSKDLLDLKPFKLSIVTQDPATKGNLYQWKWAHYDSTTACRKILKPDRERKEFVPGERRPPPIVYVGATPCCNKEKCWEYDPCLDCLYTASDALTNGNTIVTPVGAFPFDMLKPYFIIFEQFSISPEYFQFLKIIQTQIVNSGGIFDNAPAKVPGNIFNINDPNEDVLGYFSASGLTQKAVFISRDKKEYKRLSPIPEYIWGFDPKKCLPCGGAYRTNRQPFGWKE
jgi:Domain of unknown function (DUF4249)